MRVVVEVKEADIKLIAELLKNKKFSSLSEFISLSIQNQITLEMEKPHTPTLESMVKSIERNFSHYSKNDNQIERIKKIDIENIQTVPNIDIQYNFPFWGTQNKYLCLKQIVISFIELIKKEKSSWIRYDIVMNYILNKAIETRNNFEYLDSKLKKNRGERFSTGFPKNDSKSITRYEKQFIGGIDRNGNYFGMAIAIGFLSVRFNKTTNRVEFGITDDGVKFSILESPIFLKNITNITTLNKSFSNEEISFLIEVLGKNLKAEIELMEFTLNYIKSGKIFPKDGKEITKQYLDKKYPEIAENKKGGCFSLLEAETIRSGVISRLKEFRLINIIKKGIRSEYSITDSGNKFITNLRRVSDA